MVLLRVTVVAPGVLVAKVLLLVGGEPLTLVGSSIVVSRSETGVGHEVGVFAVVWHRGGPQALLAAPLGQKARKVLGAFVVLVRGLLNVRKVQEHTAVAYKAKSVATVGRAKRAASVQVHTRPREGRAPPGEPG